MHLLSPLQPTIRSAGARHAGAAAIERRLLIPRTDLKDEFIRVLGYWSPEYEAEATHRKLRDEFAEGRGYWPATWDGIIALATYFTEVHLQLGSPTHAGGIHGWSYRRVRMQ